MTLPLVLVDLMHFAVVPIAVLCVAWALYSTEELAKLLDAPFGSGGGALNGGTPEAVPVEMYCEQIVRELTQQVRVARQLARRVDEGAWAVTRADLKVVAYPPGSEVAEPEDEDEDLEGVDVEYAAEDAEDDE